MLTRDFQTHSFNGNPLGTCYRQLLFFAETDRFTIPQSTPRPDNITKHLKPESLQVAQLLFASNISIFTSRKPSYHTCTRCSPPRSGIIPRKPNRVPARPPRPLASYLPPRYKIQAGTPFPTYKHQLRWAAFKQAATTFTYNLPASTGVNSRGKTATNKCALCVFVISTASGHI